MVGLKELLSGDAQESKAPLRPVRRRNQRGLREPFHWLALQRSQAKDGCILHKRAGSLPGRSCGSPYMGLFTGFIDCTA